MHTIFFIHHKRHTQTHIPQQYSPPFILFLSVAGEDIRREEKLSAVGFVIIFKSVCGNIFETFSVFNA